MSDNQTARPTTFLYRLAGVVVPAFFRLFYRVQVEGVEHVPTEGGIIVASNHISNFDPPLLGVVVPRYIRFMGKAELFSTPVLGNIFKELGAFPIHRGKVDKHAIRTAIEVVQKGGCLVMFPEGHRSKTGELGEFMPGIAHIARKGGGKIVPTAIVGSYRRFKPMLVRFGKPLDVAAFPNQQLMEELRQQMIFLLQQNKEKV
ncbi:lysophospholipid acyltransferase family protein [Alicyclobacillus fodiniaquatilis]|jgi:1-acyl-sn-glycerol-3-phosphate acyltransferase|uniref:1-acyl-sn-glycerol-3-phosphate acyltransferase n=1 Tax=Alicyclobacillus fodiniaquatilis TaxID=1661150 RepID=A0ABW4JMT4_9BACL